MQRIAHIQESGLIIYRQIPETNNEIQSRSNGTSHSFILENITSKDMFTNDDMAYFDYYKINCPRCRHIIEKYRTFLSSVTINKNDIFGICHHCRWKHSKEPCKSCKKIAEHFLTVKDIDKDNLGQAKCYMSNINKLLKNITIGDKVVNKKCRSQYSLHELYDPNSKLVHLSYSLPDVSKSRKARFVDHISLISNSDHFVQSTSEEDLRHGIENRSHTSKEKISGLDLIYHGLNESLTKHGYVKTYITEDDFILRKQLSDFNRNPQRDDCITHEGHNFTRKSTNNMCYTKELGARPMNKHTLDNTLSRSISAVIQQTVKDDLTYYFPKDENFEVKPLKQTTSSELIRNTQVILKTKAENERMRLEHDNLLKEKKLNRKINTKQKNKDKFEIEKKIQSIKDFCKRTPLINEFKASLKIRESYLKFQETNHKSKNKRKSESSIVKISKTTKHDTKEKHALDADKKENRITKHSKKHIENKDLKEPGGKETRPVKSKKEIKLNVSAKENIDKLNKKDHTIKRDSKKTYMIQSMPLERGDDKNELPIKKVTNRNNIKSQSGDLVEYMKNKHKKQNIHKGLKEYGVKEHISNALNKVTDEMNMGHQSTHGILPLKAKFKLKSKEQQKHKDIKECDGVKNIINKSEDKANIHKEKETKVSETTMEKVQSENKTSIKSGEEPTQRNTKTDRSAVHKFKEQTKLNEMNVLKTQEMPTTNYRNVAQVKLRKPSIDDTILQLVKINENVKSLILQHKGHGVKNADCLICKDSNSDWALAHREGIIDSNVSDIIIGEKIFKHNPHLTEVNKEHRKLPLLFESIFKVDLPDDRDRTDVILSKISQDADNKEDLCYKRRDKTVDEEIPKGIIRYALSDRSFIEKGWTMLPTEKVVRKMNVYRMRPAHPEFDWFEHNKSKRLIQYDTGEKFAEFDDNGRGRWFYKNGRVALDYYDAEEINAQQRFVVYSSGETDERGRSHPLTILATFDYLGNGIVFDHVGKIRLKYNQTEGVLLDKSLGPVSHWKWHGLNDPPVLQQVMIDTQMTHKDPKIIELGGPNELKKRLDNEEMLAIEFENFIKEKSKKLSQSFKPFQIKMKALKINEQFSLKVLDQATIYLIFREGSANLKLNLGMILDHKEIVDTDSAEMGEVSNNLERLPACTNSIARLQSSLARAQFAEKLRVERDKRIRPALPTASIDRLVAASSRPVRPLIHTAECTSGASVSCACKYRKPTNNLYYDTRIL